MDKRNIQRGQQAVQQQAGSAPPLQGVDHIHLYVPDKNSAAVWYAENLGFEIDHQFGQWNTDSGPLMLKDSAGSFHLALFSREQYTPIRAVALRTDGRSFEHWRQHLKARGLPLREADYGLSQSVFIADPWGNEHEITTYREA